MSTTIAPLTPDLWADFEDLFGKQGACYGCWCTLFPAGAGGAARQRQAAQQGSYQGADRGRAAAGASGFRGRQGGRLDADRPARRRARMEQSGQGLGAGRSGRRRRPERLGDLLLLHPRQVRAAGASAIAWSRAASPLRARTRARLVEACPIDRVADSRSIGLFVGSSRVFEKAGFERLVERKAGRPLMRLVL